MAKAIIDPLRLDTIHDMSWLDDEPVRGGYPDPSLLAMSGLDRLHAERGHLMLPPPIHHLFGLQPVSASPGSVTFSMPCSPWLQTDAGVFTAGTAALVADAALGGAVMAPLGAGKVIVTSDLSFNFLRPVGIGSGHLIARARTIEVGRTLGLAEALVEDGIGRVVAHCTTRCFVLEMDGPEAAQIAQVQLPVYETPDPYERLLSYTPMGREVWGQMSWLEFHAARSAGQFPQPPFLRLFGIGEGKVEPDHFSCSMKATPWHTSPSGTVYGGVLAYLADASLTAAFSTTLEANQVAAPLDLKVQFIRPVWPDEKELTADATVVHRGRNFATARCEITNTEGKLIAQANSSAAIRSGRSWSSFVVADEAAGPPGR